MIIDNPEKIWYFIYSLLTGATYRYYSRGDTPESAVDMYISQNEWEAAHKVAMTCMKQEEIAVLYITHAQDMEAKGRYKEAEK